jgi:hypothetical protein
MIGLGTLINIGTIVTGSAVGVAIGSKLPERTNRVVTDALGLITLIMGGLNLAALGDPAFVGAVGAAAPFLIVIGSLLIGSIIGSLLGIESRLELFGSFLHAKMGAKSDASSGRERFIQGDDRALAQAGPQAATDFHGLVGVAVADERQFESLAGLPALVQNSFGAVPEIGQLDVPGGGAS